MKRLLPLSLIFLFSLSTTAQITKPGSGKQRTKKSAPAGPKKLTGKSIILVVMDADGTLEVDYEKIWDFKKGDTWKSDIAAGEHVVKFYNDIASWESTVTNKSGQQQIVNTKLQPAITTHNLRIQREEEARIAAEREAKRKKEEAERNERERIERQKREAEWLRNKPKRDWEEATSANTMESYSRYLSEQPNGAHVAEARKKMAEIDEDAYDRAKTEGTQPAYKYYLSNYRLGKYRADIQKRLDDQIEEDVFQKAKNSNLIEDYEAYESRYPTGKYINIVRETIQKGYLSLGDRAFAKKRGSKSSNQEAEKFYAKYVSRYPSGPEVGLARKKLNKTQSRLRRISRPNRFAVQYWLDIDPYNDGDPQSYLGLNFVLLSNRKIGGNLGVRLNGDVFRGGLYTINDNRELDNGDIVSVDYDRRKNGRMDLMMGLNYNPVFPLWVYLNGGLGYYPVFDYQGTPSAIQGDYGEYSKNTDQTQFEGLFEFGLMVDLWGFNFSVGACAEGFKRVYPTFGIGFSVKRY